MKRLKYLIVAAALPLLLNAQATKPAAPEPKDIVISTYRVSVKSGHDDAFKAAIAVHAQKYHKGDWSWRIGEIMSGPDGGKFQIVEGPFSWTGFDSRGDLGADHMKDYETTVMPHVDDTTPDTYATYEPDLSTVGATQWSNKVIVIRYTVKPGKTSQMEQALRFYKQINAKRGYSVGVWRSAYSGHNVFSVVYRMKAGWKDLDDDSPSTRSVANELGGPDGYANLQADIAASCSDTSAEMTEYKPALGSK